MYSAQRVKALVILISVLLFTLAVLLLVKLKDTQEQNKEKNRIDNSVEQGAVFIDQEQLQTRKISGILRKSPSVDDNNFLNTVLSFEVSGGNRVQLRVLGYLNRGPQGNDSVIIEKKSSQSIQEEYTTELYSVERAVDFLAKQVGKKVTLTVVFEKDQADMGRIYDEIMRQSCDENCKNQLEILKMDTLETARALSLYEQKQGGLSGQKISAILTKIYVEE